MMAVSQANGSSARISSEHVALLRARGIPLDLAEAVGLQSADAVVASKLLGFDKPCESGGLAIPYPETHPTYYRIRMDRGGARYLCPKKRPIPAYRAPAYDAVRPSDLADVLVVVEAPLKALAMAAAGLNAIGLGGVATTLDQRGELNASWKALNLKGRDVRIMFDANRATNDAVRDAEGRLVSALERAGASVRVCSLPPTDTGEDQGPDDYLAGHGAEALYEIIRGAAHTSPWTSLVVPAPEAWFTDAPPKRKWLLRDSRTSRCDGIVPLGKTGQVIAAGGVGKTMVDVQLGIAVATGFPWLGTFEVASPGRVLLALAEEDAEECHRRIYRARRAMGAPIPAANSLIVLPLAGEPCAMLEKDERGNMQETRFLPWLRTFLAAYDDWRLIIFDPLSRFAGPEAETDNAAGTRFVQALESIARQTGATVLNAHHTNKGSRKGEVDGTAGRGSTSLFDGARWQCSMASEQVAIENADVRERLGQIVTLTFTKANYSRKVAPIVLRHDLDNGGALVPLDEADLAFVQEARGTDPVRVARKSAKDAYAAKMEGERCAREDAALTAILAKADAPTSKRELRAALAAALGTCSHDRADAAIARRRITCST